MKKWVSLFAFVLLMVACQKQLAPLEGTAVPTDTAAPAATTAPTATATATSQPSPTKINLEPALITTLGEGALDAYAYSPDGSILAIFANDRLAWYASDTLEELGAIEYEGMWQDGGRLVISPDNQYAFFAFGYMGGYFLDLAHSKPIPIPGDGGYSRAAFSPDSRYVGYVKHYSTTGAGYSQLQIYDFEDGSIYSPEFQQERNSSGDYRNLYISQPAFSPDGTQVAVGTGEKFAYIFDLETQEEVFRLPHASTVNSLSYDPAGQYLATGGSAGILRLWNGQTGTQLYSKGGLSGEISAVNFAADGSTVEVLLANGRQYLWAPSAGTLSEVTGQTVNPGRDLYRLGYLAYPYSKSIAISQDGRLAAIGGIHVLVWDLETHALLGWLENPIGDGLRRFILGLSFSPDGRLLAAILKNGTVLVWDLEAKGDSEQNGLAWIDEKPIVQLEAHTSYGQTWWVPPVFSSDGSKLAYVDGSTVRFVDPYTGAQRSSLDIGRQVYWGVELSFSADDTKLYILDMPEWDAVAQVRDIKTGAMLREYALYDSESIKGCAFSGNLLAINVADDAGERVELWDLDSGDVRVLDKSEEISSSLAFSSDGRLLSAITTEARLVFWQIDTGARIFSSPQSYEDWGGQSQLALNSETNVLAAENGGKLAVYDISILAAQADTLAQLALATPTPQAIQGSSPTPNTVPPAVEYAQYPLEELGGFSRGVITSAGWTKDGSQIMITSSQGVYFYDPTTLQLERQIDAGFWVNSAVVGNDGRTVLAGNRGNEIVVWDADSQREVTSFAGTGRPALKPDVSQVAFASALDYGLHLRELETGAQINLPSYYSWVYDSFPEIVYSPDGAYLAAVQTDGSVRIWASQDGATINGVNTPDGIAESVTFSADSRYVITAGGGYVRIDTAAAGGSPLDIQVLPDYQPPGEDEVVKPDNRRVHAVTAAALSADGRYLAAGTGEGMLFLYDLVEGSAPVSVKGHSNKIVYIAFNPAGTKLLSVDADGEIFLRRVPSGDRIVDSQVYSGEIEGLLFRADGDLAVWVENTAWDLSAQDAGILSKTQIDTGTIYAVNPVDGQVAVYNPLHMELWDAQGQFKRALAGEAEREMGRWEFYEDMFGAAFSPDGQRIAIVGSGGIWIDDVTDGELLTRIENWPYYESVTFSPDGQYIAGCNYPLINCSTEIFEVSTGKKGATLLPEDFSDEEIMQFRFSPDGQSIGAVTAPYEEAARLYVWDASNSSLIDTVELPGAALYSLAFSPDGKLAAVGADNGVIYIIDLENWTVLGKALAHTGAVTQLAFSANGSTLASGSADGTVKLWKMP